MFPPVLYVAVVADRGYNRRPGDFIHGDIDAGLSSG